MTGLDKILRQIKSESDTAAAAIVAKAQQTADALAADARARAQADCEAIAQRSRAEVADALARAESASALQKRKAILAEKQALITQTISKAKQALAVLPDAEYFGIVVRMARKSALAQAGEIRFSQRDLDRLPADFEATLNAAIREQGGKLKIVREPVRIDGGFVLSYGGVEENCSFSALFDAAHESLQDKVHQLLFS